MLDDLSPTILLALGSIAVHADELLSIDGREADKEAIRGLLSNKELREWIKKQGCLLPLKRRP